MAFHEITDAQRNSDYFNISDTGVQIISLSRDGSALLKVAPLTVEMILRELVVSGKEVIISTGSAYFLAGDYQNGQLSASLVRIVGE